jgi:hypothetical protein
MGENRYQRDEENEEKMPRDTSQAKATIRQVMTRHGPSRKRSLAPLSAPFVGGTMGYPLLKVLFVLLAVCTPVARAEPPAQERGLPNPGRHFPVDL